jgi:hypothetical protein
MDEKKVMKELRQIRNLLILIAIKLGATATEAGEITGIGYSNISALFPQRSKKRKTKA